MSTSDLYIVFKTKAKHYATYKNGWGSAPSLWEYFSQKYFNKSFDMSSDNHDHHQKVWNLVNDKNIDLGERLCLFTTLDNSVISSKVLKQAGEAAIILYDNILKTTEWKWNHWKLIGEDLINLSKMKLDYRMLGIGLSATSISDPFVFYNGKKEICTETCLI